jgi:hypothetical protein
LRLDALGLSVGALVKRADRQHRNDHRHSRQPDRQNTQAACSALLGRVADGEKVAFELAERPDARSTPDRGRYTAAGRAYTTLPALRSQRVRGAFERGDAVGFALVGDVDVDLGGADVDVAGERSDDLEGEEGRGFLRISFS